MSPPQIHGSGWIAMWRFSGGRRMPPQGHQRTALAIDRILFRQLGARDGGENTRVIATAGPSMSGVAARGISADHQKVTAGRDAPMAASRRQDRHVAGREIDLASPGAAKLHA